MKNWQLPIIDNVLKSRKRKPITEHYLQTTGRKIVAGLGDHNIPVSYYGANIGPVVCRFLIKPGYTEAKNGKKTIVKIAKIESAASDLALHLGVNAVRVSPDPDTHCIGIEVPTNDANIVSLKEMVLRRNFIKTDYELPIILGETVRGESMVIDLTAAPHLLIAGATGSGKSVGINSFISTLLLQKTPDELKFIMIDPKRVELGAYSSLPHMKEKVVSDMAAAAETLFEATVMMDERYELLEDAGARNIQMYNQSAQKKLPYIVLIIDELADLMMTSKKDVEKYIIRLAQKARAVGIHLIVATQRPSVDFITGPIKANFPSRLSFSVATGADSKVILDGSGAETLLGNGDSLYMAAAQRELLRLQGVFVSDKEIAKIINHWKG